MNRKLGIVCMVLGIVLMLGAGVLYMYNCQEDISAQESAQDTLSVLAQQVQENTNNPSEKAPELQKPVELLTEEDKKMTEVTINSVSYIGYLSIPSLGLDLPVTADWSYQLLRKSPCRYHGSVRGEDLVLMAHNYSSHFGKISQLALGDSVVFTDMDGAVTYYEVVGEDVLDPTSVEEFISGDFDLTLFTCTYGGEYRVTVYCDKAAA